MELEDLAIFRTVVHDGYSAEGQQAAYLDVTHLGAAFGRPSIGIYCDHEPGLAGITGSGRVASIGGKGIVPSRNDVLALLEQQLAP